MCTYITRCGDAVVVNSFRAESDVRRDKGKRKQVKTLQKEKDNSKYNSIGAVHILRH